MNENKTPRAAALLPIAVFLVLYLGLGIVLEYVLKVKMCFFGGSAGGLPAKSQCEL